MFHTNETAVYTPTKRCLVYNVNTITFYWMKSFSFFFLHFLFFCYNMWETVFSFSFILTGVSPSSFCHKGVLGGFESTSHFKDTSIPSLNGYPKPGVREIANDGVSAKTYYSHVNSSRWYCLVNIGEICVLRG